MECPFCKGEVIGYGCFTCRGTGTIEADPQIHQEEYIEYKCPCGEETAYGICQEEDGTFHIDSCDSHGGCVAADKVKYCPYCGKPLETLSKPKEIR